MFSDDNRAPRRRLSAVVAERIQESILARALAPGARLPTEAELVREQGVSRAVVREAGRVLEDRGLVAIRPGRGMVVAMPNGTQIAAQYAILLQMDRATFAQLMHTRVIVEAELAALAARNRSRELLVGMRGALGRARASSTDHAVVLHEDLLFHKLISAAAANPFFALFVDAVNICLRNLYSDSARYLAGSTMTLDEHEAIYTAIESRDEAEARSACIAHLSRITAQREHLLPSAYLTRSEQYEPH